ncbi:uncharacterized protein LOC111027531 [Myzus persicae]|uniref:uncharacterized protein LOC111027531 n=1 Tax=Myzus persicae TaxID=13164 RepID=UPI000B9358D0|nr:uncharacterized protein LOC111027531 [Myzus persicae]
MSPEYFLILADISFELHFKFDKPKSQNHKKNFFHTPDSYRKLSISSTVCSADVLGAFMRPTVYRLAILYTLVSRRSDVSDVQDHLRLLINSRVEVIPIVLLKPYTHRSLCDWMHVGENEPRSRRVIQTRAEMEEAGTSHALVRLE